MIARIADWATIVTAPLTIFGTLAARLGWIGPSLNRRGAPESETAASSVAVLLIVVVWTFFFFAHLRVLSGFSRRLSEYAAFGLACLISLLGLILVCAIEVLILEALVPSASFPLIQLGWLAVPIILWVGGAFIAVPLVASGEHRRDAL